MRLLVLFCCLWLLPGVASAAPSVGEIRVVSETWTRYTQEDGRGVAWDLLRAVYEPAGVRLRIANEPYTRAVGLVLRGEADAWVGAYRGEIDEALYPRWPYDVDPIAVLSLKDNPPPPLEGLSRFRLSWMRGYAFARYFLPDPAQRVAAPHLGAADAAQPPGRLFHRFASGTRGNARRGRSAGG